MNIGVVGVGGVGGYFGGRLCVPLLAQGAKVFFVARGRHLDVIRKDGLLLSTEGHGDIVCKPSLATSDFDDLPLLDICLICVKSYDLPGVLGGLSPKIAKNSLVLPLLNGVDIYERTRQVLEVGTVFPACVYVGTHIEEDGKVVQRGGGCTILFGPDPSEPDLVPSPLLDALSEAGISYQWLNDPYPAIWTKFLFIAAFGLVTAAFDKTLGRVLKDPVLRDYASSIMEEVRAIASARGVDLPDNIISESLGKAEPFPPETKTSFQRDIERRDKRDERDLFAGTIIRLGRHFGVATPATSELKEMLDVSKPEETRSTER